MNDKTGPISERVRNLLLEPNFASVATVRRDGSAAVTPMWVDLDGDAVLLNGEIGRAWTRRLSRDPRVTLTVSALTNPYECATLRGNALAPTADNAEEQYQRLWGKYRNRPMPAPLDIGGALRLGPSARVLFRVVVESASYRYEPPPKANADEYDAFLAQLASKVS
jgi:PPOX class probable F420-dependent enzyme